MCHMCFWKYDVPTCGTRPGWRCGRRWAWLGGLWHTWDHSQSISLKKLDIKHVSCVFLKYDVPTCGTRPGWCCRRWWAWLEGLWHTWDHSQSISLETLDIKHVSYVFLKIWRTHLWDLALLTLSTSMSMTWRPLTYLRPFPIDFSWKIGYKTCVICVF